MVSLYFVVFATAYEATAGAAVLAVGFILLGIFGLSANDAVAVAGFGLIGVALVSFGVLHVQTNRAGPAEPLIKAMPAQAANRELAPLDRPGTTRLG
jgi:hypothetical protein